VLKGALGGALLRFRTRPALLLELALVEHPSQIIRRAEASHSYGFVLIFVVITIVLAVAIPDSSPWKASIVVCQACTAVIACWTADAPKRVFRIVAVFASLSVITAVGVGIFGSSNSLLGRSMNIAGVLLVAGVIIRGIVRDIRAEGVRGRAVAGALTVYLLFGTLCGFLFGLEQALSSGVVLIASNSTLDADGSTSANMYFSFITLTTVGYGDVTPASGIARATAIFEALIGQLYLIGIVSTLGGALGKGRGQIREDLMTDGAAAPPLLTDGASAPPSGSGS